MSHDARFFRNDLDDSAAPDANALRTSLSEAVYRALQVTAIIAVIQHLLNPIIDSGARQLGTIIAPHMHATMLHSHALHQP
jgi:hypothetical protein